MSGLRWPISRSVIIIITIIIIIIIIIIITIMFFLPFVILHHTQTGASRPLHCPGKDNQDSSSIPDAKRKHISHVKALKSNAAANSNQQG